MTAPTALELREGRTLPATLIVAPPTVKRRRALCDYSALSLLLPHLSESPPLRKRNCRTCVYGGVDDRRNPNPE